MVLSNILGSILSWGYTLFILDILDLLESQYIWKLQADEYINYYIS